jgi:hypothetical protein
VTEARVPVKEQFLPSSEVLVGRIKKSQVCRGCGRNRADAGICNRKGVVTIILNNQRCGALSIETEGQVVTLIVAMDASGRIKEALRTEEASRSMRYIVR